MTTKHTIQVRDGTTVLTTVKRKLWAEQIGNFNPLFCCYQGTLRRKRK